MEMIKEAGVNMITEAGVMFGEATAAAVLGPACEGFLKSIKKCWWFDDPVLDSVKSTVENLELWIPKMEDHNMKLGGRQDEVKELREQVERGRRLLDKLSEVNDLSWFETSNYNDQLVALDASLKSLMRKLRLQLATDVKEVLVLEKENTKVVKKNTRVVKRTKRKLDEVDERLSFIQNLLKKKEQKDLEYKVETWVEVASVIEAISELDDVTRYIILIQDSRVSPFIKERGKKIRQRTQQILNLFEKATAENIFMSYIRVGELKDYGMSIVDGVNLLRNCPNIPEWTDEVKADYDNKVLALDRTLEALYNRLAGIRPHRWKCGKCDKSSGTTSTSIVDSAGFCR